jgi:hypothetical protein
MKNAVVLLTLGMLLSASCKKQQEIDKDTSSFDENNYATNVANDIGSISDEAGRNKTVSGYKGASNDELQSGPCATLKFDTLVGSNPDSITVNFGTSNCLCNDGKYRRGEILITYTGKYKDSLAFITMTTINYFVDDNGVSGSRTVKNLGHNAQGHLVYDITENLNIAKANNGGTIVYNGQRRREWLSGENTIYWGDDKYSITGSASGHNSNGRSFTSGITKPLVRDMSLACRKHFVSGTYNHTPENKPTRTIDFGDGACDDIATVTVNGKTYTVTLR